MKIYFVQKFSEGDGPQQVEAMRRNGFEFVPLIEAKLIYCASIFVMKNAKEALGLKKLPLVVYCWDYYLWSHEKQNMSGDWKEYAEFLASADLIIVPSSTQQRRLKELLGLDSEVVLSGVTTFEHTTRSGNYIVEPVRHYPEENDLWAEQAAKELGYYFIHSEHQYAPEDFKDLISNCRFLVSTFREASTGGLTLPEALWLGKPSLVSDSPYMGAVDYLGPYRTTFKYDSFKDLKKKMKEMWENPPQYDIPTVRKFISENLTYDIMAKKLLKLCQRFT